MKNCPNCGALISDGQTNCSICNTPINTNVEQPSTNVNTQPNMFINSLSNNNNQVNHVYEPLPEIKNEIDTTINTTEVNNNNNNNSNNTTVSNNEVTNNSTKPTDEEKKNVMGNILKEHEEKNKVEKKDDSVKAAILSVFVVIIIIVGGYYAVKLGFDKINDGQDNILNQVKDQANNYSTIVKDYMKKYDYKTKSNNLNGYYAKSRTFAFLPVPLTSKCEFNEGKWIGAEGDDVTCESFFSDINNNYCQAVPCSIPSSAGIYLKETNETMQINGNEETVATGTILDGTVLTYDDVTCTLSSDNYKCEYIEKQE